MNLIFESIFINLYHITLIFFQVKLKTHYYNKSKISSFSILLPKPNKENIPLRITLNKPNIQSHSQFNQQMITSNSSKKRVPYELYTLKKSKQPDYLLSMLQKSKHQKQNIQVAQNSLLDFKVNEAIRRHMIRRRVDNILSPSSPKNFSKSNIVVSQPVKCLQKPWIPPMEKQVLNKKFSQQQLIIEARKKQQKHQDKQKITTILKTINLNKKMRYFGDFLSSQFDNSNKKTLSICNIPKTKESKMTFLESKYKKLMAKSKPKLFVLNSPSQQQKYFFNPLKMDEYFSCIMKASDKELMRILINTLSEQGHFSLTSFSKFYDIFVWQSAQKQQLTKFAAKMLMGERQELSISAISSRIDEICEKINLQELNQGVDNFSEIVKKLLFGEEFVFALKNQYFLTRKALIDSLEKNEECISIFVNVFYG